jgi:hypothetical protein
MHATCPAHKKITASRTITQGLLTTALVNLAVRYLRSKGPAISQNNKCKYVYDKTIIFHNKMGISFSLL